MTYQLLVALDRPDVPLHTTAVENDAGIHVIRRKISSGTRSDSERTCRDAFLGHMKTCAKHGISSQTFLIFRRSSDNIEPRNLPQLPYPGCSANQSSLSETADTLAIFSAMCML